MHQFSLNPCILPLPRLLDDDQYNIHHTILAGYQCTIVCDTKILFFPVALAFNND